MLNNNNEKGKTHRSVDKRWGLEVACLMWELLGSRSLCLEGSAKGHVAEEAVRREGTEPHSAFSLSSFLSSGCLAQTAGRDPGGTCCCSVAKSCLTVCDPMNCSTPGSPSFTISWSSLKLMSIESVMPSNYLILCSPLLLLSSLFPSIRWPKYWSFSFSISPPSEYAGLISLGLTGSIALLSKGLPRVFSSTTIESINVSVLSLVYGKGESIHLSRAPAGAPVGSVWYTWSGTVCSRNMGHPF